MDPPSKLITKLANTNAIKPEKVTKKFGKNLMDPPPGFSTRVHLYLGLNVEALVHAVEKRGRISNGHRRVDVLLPLESVK